MLVKGSLITTTITILGSIGAIYQVVFEYITYKKHSRSCNIIFYILVSCLIWDRKNEVRKAELSMLEISSVIIGKVEAKQDSMDYFYIGIIFSTILAFLPVICTVINISTELTFSDVQHFLDEVYGHIGLTESLTNKNCTVFSFYKGVLRELLGRGKNFIFAVLNGSLW